MPRALFKSLSHTGGTIDFRSKDLEPIVGRVFKIENFGLENATPPLNLQYGKELSSEISGTGFFSFVPLFLKNEQFLFPSRILSCEKILVWRFVFQYVPLICQA